jgi:hypothetical protein
MMNQQEIQTLIDRLLLLARTLGWTMTKIDTGGDEIIIELRRAKEK